MTHNPVRQLDELHEIVDQKLTALIREMEEADWSTDDVVSVIDGIVKNRWLARAASLEDARDAVPKNFISDGNEG